jgi:three-Cys-motif partner protein
VVPDARDKGPGLSGELRDDDPKKWIYTEHAGVKHEIQRRYLGAWLAILGAMKPLLLFDGFAGRGHYVDGEPGSPLIFWDRAVEAVGRGRPAEVEIDCVEANEANFKELGAAIADLDHQGVTIRAHHGEFATQALAKAKALRGLPWVPPVFWTADPYGFRGVPLGVLKELMALPRSEVMLTFMVRDMRRFLAEASHEAPLTELFGGDDWRACLELSPGEDREQKILLTYSELVRRDVARFATPFRVFEDDRAQTLYYLIHLTNEPLGMRKMKEAMVKQSADMTFWPLTLRAPDQIALDVAEADPYPTLQEYLVDHYLGRAILFEELLNDDYPRGVWVEPHYRAALGALAKSGRVEIGRSRGTLSGRRPTGIKLEDTVTFGDQQLSLV